jgi:hypothetical protein
MEDKNIHVIHIFSPDSPMMSLSKNILSCVPCCRFLWIVRSWLPIRCSLTLDCCLGYILFCPIVINIESYICYKNLWPRRFRMSDSCLTLNEHQEWQRTSQNICLECVKASSTKLEALTGLEVKEIKEVKVIDIWPQASNKVRVLVFNVTFNNISAISWVSVLWVEETGLFSYCATTRIIRFEKFGQIK